MSERDWDDPVQTYRDMKVVRVPNTEWAHGHRVCERRADAAIAALEAVNDELRKQNEILATARRLEETEREQAEAELAALRARRCETCKNYDVDTRFCAALTQHWHPDFWCAGWADGITP